MRCPGCNAENPEDSKFCGTCGQTLQPSASPAATAVAPEPPAPPPAPPPPAAPAPRKTVEDPPAFEPPPPPKERPEDDTDDPFSKISRTRKGTAVIEKKNAQGDEPAPPGAPAKSHALCEECKGAFPVGALKKVDGVLVCDLCISIKEKAKKKGPIASAMPFNSPSAGSGMPSQGFDGRPQQKAQQKVPSVKTPVSGAMVAVIVVAVVVLLGLVGFGVMMAFSK